MKSRILLLFLLLTFCGGVNVVAQSNQSEFYHLLSSDKKSFVFLHYSQSRGSCYSRLGNFILEDNFFHPHSPSNSVAMEIGGKWGFVNLEGKIIIPPVYDEVKVFSCGLAAVCKNGKWGYINEKNETVIPCQYVCVSQFEPVEDMKIWYEHDGLEKCAIVYENYSSCYLINEKGERVNDKIYNDYGGFSTEPGLISVKIDNKWGYIDFAGNIIIEPRFDYVYDFSSGVAAVKVNGKWGYINTKGEYVLEPQFKDGGYFRCGMLGISMGDGQWGFMNLQGDTIGSFDDQYSFMERTGWKPDVAWVNRDGKWGLIDTKGNIKIPFLYRRIYSANKEVMLVMKNNKWGYIDDGGNIVYPFIFDSASPFCKMNNIALVTFNGKCLYLHKSEKSTYFNTYKEAYERQNKEKEKEAEEDEFLFYLDLMY